MKTYELKSTPPSIPCQHALSKALEQAGTQPVIALGLDIELATPAGAIIIGGGTPLDLGKHPRPVWLALVRWLRERHATVHVSQEACGFGWGFHRDLESVGAKSLVVAPEDLNGQRKTDRRDARQLATALWDYHQRGNTKALRPVRIPAVEEQQRRAHCRQRSQCLETRHRLEAHGRSLLWDHDWLTVPEGWWKPRVWPRLEAELKAAGKDWLIAMLTPHRQIILSLQERLAALEKIILPPAAAAPDMQTAVPPSAEAATTSATVPTAPPPPQPKGLGAPTIAQIDAEVMDWQRFQNRGQAGSFIGCCPSERSSGKKQKLGSIDRIGNKRIRTMLVEAVWRLRQWNPGWRGFKKFAAVLGPGAKCGTGPRKKAIVACARLLMIDLWRLKTGRTTMEALGLIPA
jgi:transposase